MSFERHNHIKDSCPIPAFTGLCPPVGGLALGCHSDYKVGAVLHGCSGPGFLARCVRAVDAPLLQMHFHRGPFWWPWRCAGCRCDTECIVWCSMTRALPEATGRRHRVTTCSINNRGITYQTDEKHLTIFPEYFVGVVKLVTYSINTHLLVCVTNNLLKYVPNWTSKNS